MLESLEWNLQDRACWRFHRGLRKPHDRKGKEQNQREDSQKWVHGDRSLLTNREPYCGGRSKSQSEPWEEIMAEANGGAMSPTLLTAGERLLGFIMGV
jgi:hypothetical protein